MNREVHVRFWESAGLRCPALLDYLHAYESVSQAGASIGRTIEFYNTTRPHSSLRELTPDQVYFNCLPEFMAA